MHSTERNGLVLLGLGVAMIAGMAFAADSRFDDANASVDKAIALLKAAQIPAGKSRAEHRRHHAVEMLEHVKRRITCAKELADGKEHCTRPEDDDDGDGTPKGGGDGTPKGGGGTPKGGGGTPKGGGGTGGTPKQ